MKLTNQEKLRYSRHLSLSELGEKGQERLKKSKVLVIGAGGLGGPVLQYLAAAGVGAIGIVDSDVVESHNLQRQILFDHSNIGKSKAVMARNRLTQMNPYIDVTAYDLRLNARNALEIFSDYQLIIDASDNFPTRYLVNDACVILNKTWVYGAVDQFEGQISVFNDGDSATYRCLFPDFEKGRSLMDCEERGVLGIIPGLVGTQMANEALKFLLGMGDLLSGKLLLINALTNQHLSIESTRHQDQIDLALSRKKGFEDFNYDIECGVEAIDQKQIDAAVLLQWIEEKVDFNLIDVRELHETPEFELKSTIRIPFGEVRQRSNEVDDSKSTIIMCQTGIRSRNAIRLLEEHFGKKNLINLQGGMLSMKMEAGKLKIEDGK